MTTTTDPTDQYLLDATNAVLDDLPTEILGEVLAYGMRVLTGRTEQLALDLRGAQISADLLRTALQARIGAALDEQPGVPDPDDDGRSEIEHMLDDLRGRDH